MYIVYCSVYCDHFGVLIGCCVSELHAKLCLHHNVWPEIVPCCFNIVYQIVLTQKSLLERLSRLLWYSLKGISMCIPCFGRCVSELRGHLVPIVMYGLRLFIIVLQELHCLHI